MAPSSQVVVLMGHCVYGMLTQGTVLQFLKDIPKRLVQSHFRQMVESSPARVGMTQFDCGTHIIVNISQPSQQSHSVFHTLILFYPDPVDAVRKPHHRRQFKERTRLSSRNSLRLLHSKKRGAMNCATTNADILVFALFEMLIQKGAVRKPHLIPRKMR